MKRISSFALVALIAASLCSTGCFAARHRARKAQETQAVLTQQYSAYRIEMERINLERQKASLPPSPVQSFEEWNKVQSKRRW